MRLLNATTLDLHDFAHSKIPPYAILSHTWGEEEAVFDDLQRQTADGKLSWRTKVEPCCQQAIKQGHEYVWIDTCCIDKSSSAELSESINSMYAWYGKSQICYAHLEDVSADVDLSKPGSSFECSRWFTRGFTLQELIAPIEIIFFSHDWIEIGRKGCLHGIISRITLIDEEILLHKKPVASASIARRMAWAAHRETSRPEDIAYCLMGLFSVNMPMIYGENERAFLRLQEEIMKQSDDQSIFAWVDQQASPESRYGLLASSPAKFAGCADIFPYQDWQPRQPYTMTNRGLQIELPLSRISDDMYVATFDCPSPPDYKNFSFLAIFLKRLSDVDAQFARVKVSTLAEVTERSEPQTIYVRQSHLVQGINGIFPMHAMQIRSLPEQSIYRLVCVIVGNKNDKSPAVVSSSRSNVPSGHRRVFLLQKGKVSLNALVVLSRTEDGQQTVIALGSGASFDVGFDAFNGPSSGTMNEPYLESYGRGLRLRKPGTWVELEQHWVCVKTEAQVHNGSKYYMVDIEVHPIFKGRLETLVDQFERRVLSGPGSALDYSDTTSEPGSLKKPNSGDKKRLTNKFSLRRILGA